MRELMNLIPFLDVAIGIVLVMFLYLGWAHGVPRLIMVAGAVYTGFLLASIYYHLFAVTLARFFKIKSSFVADLTAFLVLLVFISILMVALLFTVFGHIEIKGRLAVFDKIVGSMVGMVVGMLVVGIVVTLLRVPYEANKYNMSGASDMPLVQVFNQSYEKSTLAPLFIQTAPYLVASMAPLLPPESQTVGAVPLLASIVQR